MADVRISIVKKLANKDLIDGYSKGVKPERGLLKIGDEFIAKDLCSWAWIDIQRDVAVLALDGNFPWVKEKGGWDQPLHRWVQTSRL